MFKYKIFNTNIKIVPINQQGNIAKLKNEQRPNSKIQMNSNHEKAFSFTYKKCALKLQVYIIFSYLINNIRDFDNS